MRTQSEIKKNNIRKANLLQESQTRNNRGKMASRFGIYEQCGTQLDMDGEYMGAPAGTEPMDMMMGNDMSMGNTCPNCGETPCMCGEMGMETMMGDNMDMMDDDDEMMGDDMMRMFMGEGKKTKPDFLDLDGDGDKTEPMKKAAKDKMAEKCGGDLEESKVKKTKDVDTDKEGRVTKPRDQPSCAAFIGGGGGCWYCHGVFQANPCEEEFDPEEFFNEGIGKRRIMRESYKAVVATPSKDGWGNNFNNILTESKQVNSIHSLMNRMKKVIK